MSIVLGTGALLIVRWFSSLPAPSHKRVHGYIHVVRKLYTLAFTWRCLFNVNSVSYYIISFTFVLMGIIACFLPVLWERTYMLLLLFFSFFLLIYS